jgi:peptidoglycan/xylan/chitin deacetylase (PgdA/CDA1 family)
VTNAELPILPLLFDDVPPGLVLALRQEGVPAAPLPVVSSAPGARGRFVLYDSRANAARTLGARLAPGQVPVDVAPLRSEFKFDPYEALANCESRLAEWRLGDARVHEHVSRYDKANIRRKLLDRLRERIEAHGGLWMRVSAFPFPYRSAFNFRIDYDECDIDDTQAVIRQVEGHADCFSHFVCVGPWQDRVEGIARLAGWDVGSHGFHHHTFRDPAENRANIARGIEVLRSLGIEPSGFAAPFGRWSIELEETLNELGVTHSSEFGLAHDDLPFFPLLGSGRGAGAWRFSDVVQVPIHPVCLGLFLEAGQHDEDRFIEYLCEVARAKYEAGTPLFFYGHPTRRLGRHPRVLPALLEATSGFGALWKTTLSRFARWWRVRSATSFSVWPAAGGFEALVRAPDRRYPMALEYCRGEHVAVLPVDGAALRFSLDGLGFERRGGLDRLPAPVDVLQPNGLREAVCRYLDWETVTPLEELRARGPRTLLKKGLRYLRAARRPKEKVASP